MFGFIPKIKSFIESVHSLIKILELLIARLPSHEARQANNHLEIIKKNLKDFEK